MKKNLFGMAFALGALAVLWIAAGFIESHLLALTMTVLIGTVYCLGAIELRHFRRSTASLSAALDALTAEPTNLDEWLAGVPAALRNPVRLRIEGERVGLPGPALTPYLVGLLVMLGMLGTFLGMVVTLNGAAFSLEGTTDLQTIRAALAAPIKGLGLAFGTSVAGVATSAMLGLMSALSRRDRMQVAHDLDARVATVLRRFSLSYQRQQAYQAMQIQAQALPGVVDQMQVLASQIERMGQQLSDRLLSGQEGFHRETKATYQALAASVEHSLKTSLSSSAQEAGASIRPVVEGAMAAIAQDAQLQHARVAGTVQAQLDGLAERFGTLVGEAQSTWLADQHQSQARHQNALQQSLDALLVTLRHEWQSAGAHTLAQQQQICSTLVETAQAVTAQTKASASETLAEIARLVHGSEDLLATRIAAEADWALQHRARLDELTGVLRAELGALKDQEALRGAAAIEQLHTLQDAATRHLTSLGTALEAPITRLLETASEAPRAAAEVIGQLRQEMSNNLARDNALLQERNQIMATVNTLLDAINHAAAEQRGAIDALVASSAQVLAQAGSRFAEQVETEGARLADVSAQVGSGAVEVSSLSESFGVAVQSFSQANGVLVENLQRIEVALAKSMARSDEQLAYYVAQAREIVDLTLLSQKEIFNEVRHASARKTRNVSEVV